MMNFQKSDFCIVAFVPFQIQIVLHLVQFQLIPAVFPCFTFFQIWNIFVWIMSCVANAENSTYSPEKHHIFFSFSNITLSDTLSQSYAYFLEISIVCLITCGLFFQGRSNVMSIQWHRFLANHFVQNFELWQNNGRQYFSARIFWLLRKR